MRRSAGAPVVAVSFAAAHAGPAHAHLVSTELGPFYDGAAHPLVTPEDALAILALAIAASFVGPAGGRRLLAGLVGGWACGATAAFVGLPTAGAPPDLVTPSLLLGVGLIGLLRLRPAPLWIGAVGAAAGVIRGLDNGAAARLDAAPWLTLAGLLAGVFALASVLGGLCLRLERLGWTVALRIGASWIGAIGLLMLGWSLRSSLQP